ncbi:uncharacterized protein LOC143002631 [Genypterus blacodes]|uniref:uncharacterized protein LOC143002631 n=1 Tax=Genypterus blacodes TaxID=154954 RepID=UPI003F75ED02
MKMWLKLTTFLLLTVVPAVISVSTLLILDEPQSSVWVHLGSSVTLSCSFRIEPPISGAKIRVEWHLNASVRFTEVFDNSAKPDSKAHRIDAEKTWSHFTLTNVTLNDSGRYFCRVMVEIPFLKGIQSNGTQVHIATAVSKTEHTTFLSLPTVTGIQVGVALDWWIWAALAVGVVMLVVLVVVYVLVKRRRRAHRSRDCPIYGNTHNRQPSPRPGAQLDNLKMVPPSHHRQSPSPYVNTPNRRP